MNTRSRAVAAGVLLALGLLVIGQSSAAEVSSHSPSATDARFQPSGEGLPFDPGRYRDFDDYVLQTRERLQRHKVYMDPHRTGMEFAAAKPFERTPAAGCPPSARNRWSRGVLLLHGLSDMPLAMQDLANAFAARCFVVRTILLPGHGTRAGDLLDVTHGDWLAATRFGLETLKGDVDEVFVGGFSLGGLLAMHAVLEDATVSGAFLFSPALALESAWLIRQSLWLRHVLDWLDRDEPDDYARYEAMPVNAMAETFLLVRKFTQLLEQRRVHIPVFMSMSADDSVIDVAVNRDYFEDRFSHPEAGWWFTAATRAKVLIRTTHGSATATASCPGNASPASPICQSTSRLLMRTMAHTATIETAVRRPASAPRWWSAVSTPSIPGVERCSATTGRGSGWNTCGPIDLQPAFRRTA